MARGPVNYIRVYKDGLLCPGIRLTYRRCDIEVYEEKALGGWEQVYYSIFTHPMNEGDRAYEVDSGFFECQIDFYEAARDCKATVDSFWEAGGEEGWGW